jgi:hypothetical protein
MSAFVLRYGLGLNYSWYLALAGRCTEADKLPTTDSKSETLHDKQESGIPMGATFNLTPPPHLLPRLLFSHPKTCTIPLTHILKDVNKFYFDPGTDDRLFLYSSSSSRCFHQLSIIRYLN